MQVAGGELVQATISSLLGGSLTCHHFVLFTQVLTELTKWCLIAQECVYLVQLKRQGMSGAIWVNLFVSTINTRTTNYLP